MTTGLFGKLPAHGDFVRRGLPRSFIGPWDDWLSAGIEAARAQLGAGFEAVWEAAPVWRFRLSPGACGPAAAVGVIATSRDLVGRRFPLTLAAILPGPALPPPDAWYASLEEALGQARLHELDADALAAMLLPPPPDDPDATVDGRSLFWGVGLPARRMPAAAEFVCLLKVLPSPRGAALPPTASPLELQPDVVAAEARDPSAEAAADLLDRPPGVIPVALVETGADTLPPPPSTGASC